MMLPHPDTFSTNYTAIQPEIQHEQKEGEEVNHEPGIKN